MTVPLALPQAEDFRAECVTLHALLKDADDSVWERPTAFKDWTAIDVIGHLHMADRAAMVALDGPTAFSANMAGFLAATAAGESATAFTRRWHGISEGPALLARWRAFADKLADTYRDLDPRRRIPWGRGPDMSARSCMSARQMEVWAHGQALFDLLGQERAERDRVRNIAALGANTFGWAFRNRGLDVPEPPFLRLVAPSGAFWEWNDLAAASRIEGDAVAFCQVVTQTRNVTDTALAVTGETARRWMAIAQCFAGPPHDPPPPGRRQRADLA